MNSDEIAIRKRSQIAKANRTMFLWIAVASALVGATIVVGIFLVQQLLYNERVLAEKFNTANTLTQNNETIEELADKIRVLDTNPNLAAVKLKPEDQALQVILDALPSEANTLALGASLQNKLLTGINGLDQLEALQVQDTNAEGVDGLVVEDVEAEVVEGEGAAGSQSTLAINFEISGTQDALLQVLRNLERSIRTIDIMTMELESVDGGRFKMTVTATAYYQPPKTLELREEEVPR
jgi:hypothetical protein